MMRVCQSFRNWEWEREQIKWYFSSASEAITRRGKIKGWTIWTLECFSWSIKKCFRSIDINLVTPGVKSLGILTPGEQLHLSFVESNGATELMGHHFWAINFHFAPARHSPCDTQMTGECQVKRRNCKWWFGVKCKATTPHTKGEIKFNIYTHETSLPGLFCASNCSSLSVKGKKCPTASVEWGKDEYTLCFLCFIFSDPHLTWMYLYSTFESLTQEKEV